MYALYCAGATVLKQWVKNSSVIRLNVPVVQVAGRLIWSHIKLFIYTNYANILVDANSLC